MKSARNQLDILSAYRELGSYRAAAALCGTTHRTVRHVVERQGRPPVERPPRPKTTDPFRDLLAERLRATDGRISAKRLLPLCRAAGYTGSARHLRRAVALARADRQRERRVYRPWQPVPGEHLAIDWGSEGGLHVFCAVLPCIATLSWTELEQGPKTFALEAGECCPTRVARLGSEEVTSVRERPGPLLALRQHRFRHSPG